MKAMLVSEIVVKPGKPVYQQSNFLDMMANQIQVELKEDGIRAIVLKDPDSGQYEARSSSGSVLNGNWQNIFKQLKPALDKGWVFSGEVIDSRYPDERGKALSVAKSKNHPPEAMAYVTWNTFQITDDMIAAGSIAPDTGTDTPDYKTMRLNLISWMRKLKPPQVKMSKRFKISKDMTPSMIFQRVIDKGGEGIVAKLMNTGQSIWKMKGMAVNPLTGDRLFITPLVEFKISKSGSYSGMVTSLKVEHPLPQFAKARTFDVGQGYTDKQKRELSTLATQKNGDVSGLWVAYQGTKPAKPFAIGGVPSNPVFQFLTTDPKGTKRVVEEDEMLATERRVKKVQAVVLDKLTAEEEAKVREWIKVNDEYEEKWALLEPMFKRSEELYKEVGALMKAKDNQKAQVDDMIVEYAGYGRTSYPYSQLFKAALGMLTAEQLKQIEEMKEQMKKVSDILKIKLTQVPTVAGEGIMDKLTGLATSAWDKVAGFLKTGVMSLKKLIRGSTKGVDRLAKIVDQVRKADKLATESVVNVWMEMDPIACRPMEASGMVKLIVQVSKNYIEDFEDMLLEEGIEYDVRYKPGKGSFTFEVDPGDEDEDETRDRHESKYSKFKARVSLA